MREAIAALTASYELATGGPHRRRDIVQAVADALERRGEEIVRTAAAETGLTAARLESELARTAGQLRQYGNFVAAGRDRPIVRSEQAAAGGADVLKVMVPVGPVAVFAASNFPLAFGVLGTDTAAALAAGCPVVVKAHPAQPETSALLGRIATEALAALVPAGTFAVVHGGAEVSLALVRAPEIRAVGFTGSLTGGRALMDAAAARPDPIPVYAEMGSVNPVFVLPSALSDDAWPGIVAGAVTGSAGQLCTKPGLVFVPDADAGRDFADRLSQAVAGSAPTDRMLTPAMAAAHATWLDRAETMGTVTPASGRQGVVPFALQVTVDALHPELLTEHFGPAVVVCLAPADSYARLADQLEGSLTATILADEDDDGIRALLPVLARRVGRIILNGVPTGVAVVDAMHHGGPWPAASAASFTSVGTDAIGRFLRPLALQGLPQRLADSFTSAVGHPPGGRPPA